MENLEISTTRKIRNRIIPFLVLLYVISFLDRVNLGYAALGMNKDLGLTAQQYGLVAGIFFIAYFIFEVPSNMLLHRVGARIWLARIIITFGIISAATAFVQNAAQLYTVRFLLGIAEAGFFPGVILYLTYWFRKKDRARAIALFMTGLGLSNIIGAPISGLILDHIHWAALASWRWLYLFEGVPAIILGIITIYILSDRPSDAKWLTDKEKAWLKDELERDNQGSDSVNHSHSLLSSLKVLLDGKVVLLAVVALCVNIGMYGLGFWMPQIIKGLSSMFSNTMVGFLTVIPYLIGCVAMVLNGRHSDLTSERRYHSAIGPVIGALALLLLSFTTSPTLSILLLTVTIAGLYSYYGPFFTLPTLFLREANAAVGIAAINSVGGLGGFFGPYIIGAVKSATGSVTSSLYVLAGALVIACILLLTLKQEKAKETHLEQATNIEVGTV
ncbi:MFS transporter [Aneurinibacillus sp. Ricciae_BoGa-3]|uniref:MFS transporter n=1 Tax=Aneurinibacillus sp. Ricciae_BoGa-3 TaxID=3022697 RepID=UPI0023417ECA|nr:MFS transporter [Aneurinibacillus sp. Ricciae_BoGa-3]WCK53207.1 MFS transporter [Aneurinibacillus sp. Ricciae_BoGa-3]